MYYRFTPRLLTMNQIFCQMVAIFSLEPFDETEQGDDWLGGLGRVKI